MRKIRKKRGFTLIELIVVIAIIGVLAAILVPTLLNMVTKAKVTSANNTASEIRKSINLMLMQADSTYYGIIPSKVIKLDITVTEENGARVWSCSAANAGSYNNSNSSGLTWGTAASYRSTENAAGVTSGEKMICASLCTKFSDIKHGALVVVLSSGNCSFVVYTQDMNTTLPESEYPTIAANGQAAGVFAWDGDNAGISPGGYIVGTDPAVPLG